MSKVEIRINNLNEVQILTNTSTNISTNIPTNNYIKLTVKLMQPSNNNPSNNNPSDDQSEDQIVNPWKAETKTGKFDYQRLIVKFGVEEISEQLIERFKKVTGKEPHIWIKRGLFFAHRQLNEILDDHEKGKPIFLYTGRGPTSAAMHLGHIVPFLITKYLQDVFNAIVVIQMSDDEKYWFKDIDFETVYKLGFENARDIIACGFNPQKTYIFSNHDHTRIPCAQNLSCELMKHIQINTLHHVFGIPNNAAIGQLVWPVYQIAAAFAGFYEPIFGNEKLKCLIVYAVDQDPYFRVSRDVAENIRHPKPCAIMSQFLPALEGKSKMSTTGNTGPVTTIFLTDTEAEVSSKIKKYAFSGGRDTLKEHREKGADLSMDISYQWLKFFEEDDAKLQQIANEYGSGKMLTSEVKDYLIKKIVVIVANHQRELAKVTPELVKQFYDINKFKK